MRKTKIVCTLGPSTDDEQIMRQLMFAGMDVLGIVCILGAVLLLSVPGLKKA